MRHFNWQRNPELLAVINILAVASLLGFLYCLVALLYDFTSFARTSLLVYSLWFVVCIASVFLMKRCDVWGAYALAITTILVGFYELWNGTASLGGAILALCLIFIMLFYLLNMRQLEVDENERIRNPL